MGYLIKQIPEDFIVEEMPFVTLGEGEYGYYFLEKNNINTLEAVKMIAKRLQINVKRIGWAGNKDKYAVTNQLISFYKRKKEAISRISLKNIKLNYYGEGNKEVVIGKLIGNKFVIVVRNLAGSDCERIKKNFGILKKNDSMIANYYDEQRFGSSNAEIGKLIVKGDFEVAARLWGTDVRNFKGLHNSQLLLYVHSYQSLLFNRLLAEYVGKNCDRHKKIRYSKGDFVFPLGKVKNAEIPVIGFGTELAEEKILKEEGITTRNFVIRQLPDISSEGTMRDAFVKVSGLEVSDSENDELNNGMQKIRLSFSLPKGSYGTVVVKVLNF